MMFRSLLATFVAAVGVFVAVVAVSSQTPSKTEPAAPAVVKTAVAETFPNGCVSCHIKKDGNDTRLNVLMGKMADHPDISSMVSILPKDCSQCHKAGGSMGSLSARVHKAHYAKMDKSLFVKEYCGSCVHCHEMDPKSGKVTVKSGKKNW